jgi:hypothetical protein
MVIDPMNKQLVMKQDGLRFIGYFLLAGFLMPIIISGFGMTKILFINFSMLGKGSLFQTMMFIHPLLAGIAALWMGKRVPDLKRPITLLVLGLFPIVLILGDDLISDSLRGLKFQTSPIILLVLSVIGLYVGSRHFSKTGYPSGKWIAGLSAGVFLLVSVVPVTGAKPVFFSFFDLLKMGRISSRFVFLGLALIGVFLCYMYAALTAFINLKDPPTAGETSARAAKVVLLSSWVIPLASFLVSLTGGGFFMVLFGYLKFTLWIGGVVGLIGWAWLDLLEQLEPASQTGAQLFKDIDESTPPADSPPPSIWNGPPPTE